MQDKDQVTSDDKTDALALAQLIFDLFVEDQHSDRIASGQNNAPQNNN